MSATAIVAVGEQRQAPALGWVVAVAAAMQESGLRPLPYGDRDSLGLFQQRSGWGTEAQRMDPAASAAMFFTGGHGGQPGLLDIDGWRRLSLAEAAQAVQVSGYPDAYARWEPVATAIVERISHQTVTACGTSGTWVSPVESGQYVLTAGFGVCGELWQSCHTGLDFAAPTGTPVMAAAAGVVTYSGVDIAYGNLIYVQHPGGVATWYGHLSQRIATAGQRVDAGDVIGLVGDTGNATGPHLHLEVRLHVSASEPGTPVDPFQWLRRHDVST